MVGGLGGVSFGAGRRASLGGFADGRRNGVGSSFTPAARPSTSYRDIRYRGVGLSSSGYKRGGLFSGGVYSDEDDSPPNSSDEDGRSLTAQFEDNNAIPDASSQLGDELDDGWESDRDHRARMSR